MKFEDLRSMWDEDKEIGEISETLRNNQSLHNKYYNILVSERLLLYKLDKEYKKLTLEVIMFMDGKLPNEDIVKHKWNEKFPLPVYLKTMQDRYIESHEFFMARKEKIEIQSEKVEYLKAIIKQINDRHFLCNTILKNEMFKNGMNG